MEVWVAPILNRLKGIVSKVDSLKEEVAKDSTVAKENTNQEIKTTAREILNKVSSGGDISTLENMISSYINETGARYVPSWDTPYFLIGSTIDGNEGTSITTDTTYTWEAKYAGEIMVAYYGSSSKSSYLSICEILKNTEQITKDWLDATGVAENKKKVI